MGGYHGSGAEQGSRRPPGMLTARILRLLWSAGAGMTAGQVQAELAVTEPRKLAYSTIVTVLSRLYARGVVGRFPSGRAYAYWARTDQSQLAARRMRRLLEAEDNRRQVLASFVSDLSPGDEDVLRQLLGSTPDAGASTRFRT
jgi:predicted transcriptional regulator